jgi:hypothetical protein
MEADYIPSQEVVELYTKLTATILDECKEKKFNSAKSYRIVIQSHLANLTSVIHNIAKESKEPKMVYTKLIEIGKQKLDASIPMFDVIEEFIKFREGKK